MTQPHRFRVTWVLATAISLSASACRDLSSNSGPGAPIDGKAFLPEARRVESQVIWSNDDPVPGEAIVMVVTIRRGADVRPVSSYTARVLYDSTSLRFEGDRPLDDGALRVVNPIVGDARLAGLSQYGFAEGSLAELRFTALSRGATAGVRVIFDELHAVGREDLMRVLPAASIVNRRIAQ